MVIIYMDVPEYDDGHHIYMMEYDDGRIYMDVPEYDDGV